MLEQKRHVSPQAETNINWKALETCIRSIIEELDSSPMIVKQFSEGYSNLTFHIQIGSWEAVMRRPPFGKIPPKAHDIEREYKLLQKINPVFPLAPKPYFYHEDPFIMDKHFYLMEKKTGIVLDEIIPNEYDGIPGIRRRISESVIDTLAELHEIDYKQAGLAQLGRPEGYLERQVHGWFKRYENSKTDDISIYDDVKKWILSHIPESPSPTIIHNDFKLNNMMFSLTEPGKPVAVFDWELSAIGDPLTDLAAAVAYWKNEDDPYTAINSVTSLGGFYTRDEFLQRYAEKSKRDLSQFDFYLAFAYFKIAAILQQIYYRWKMGYLLDDRFSRLHEGIKNLLILSHDTIYLRK